MWFFVDDPLVARVALYKPRHTLLRLDVVPFVVLYSILHGWCFVAPSAPTAALIAIPCVLAAHLLVYLCTQWSVGARCFVGFMPALSIGDARFAWVIPQPNNGVESLVPLELLMRPVLDFGTVSSPIMNAFNEPEALLPPEVTFTFQKTVFWWVDGDNLIANEGAALCPGTGVSSEGWRRVAYPTRSRLTAYLGCRGYESMSQREAAAMRWGDNSFELPSPRFVDLLGEHVVAPMFVFQVDDGTDKKYNRVLKRDGLTKSLSID
jgi:cation-transporting ATPase 13A1